MKQVCCTFLQTEHTSAQHMQTNASSTCKSSLDRQDNGAYDALDLLITYSSSGQAYTRAALITVCYFDHILAGKHCPKLVQTTKLDDVEP